MGYRKAEEILPMEIIELIQQYVDGESIYIPRKSENRQEWGSSTGAKQQVRQRNREIYTEYAAGKTVSEMADKYFLSEKSIQRIIRTFQSQCG